MESKLAFGEQYTEEQYQLFARRGPPPSLNQPLSELLRLPFCTSILKSYAQSADREVVAHLLQDEDEALAAEWKDNQQFFEIVLNWLSNARDDGQFRRKLSLLTSGLPETASDLTRQLLELGQPILLFSCRLITMQLHNVLSSREPFESVVWRLVVPEDATPLPQDLYVCGLERPVAFQTSVYHSPTFLAKQEYFYGTDVSLKSDFELTSSWRGNRPMLRHLGFCMLGETRAIPFYSDPMRTPYDVPTDAMYLARGIDLYARDTQSFSFVFMDGCLYINEAAFQNLRPMSVEEGECDLKPAKRRKVAA